MTTSFYVVDSELEQKPTETTLSRQSSSISYECHSNMIFEEMFSAFDDDEDDDDFSLNGIIDEADQCVTDHEENRGEKYITETPVLLEAILNDGTTPLTQKFEARAINKAMRRGNSMLLRRCSSDIVQNVRRTPSFVDRVISSVSAELRATGYLKDDTALPTPGCKNATFSPVDGLNRARQEKQIANISKVGRSLLASSSRKNKRVRSERQVSIAKSDANLMMESFGSLDKSDFLKILNE
mmetsp:Transcript_61580/g.181974  ORF Transcript_61580/g.181974 Transcript_61580/m.181974 type:complete len:240 (-) Transcript_61580:223-942(-)